MPAARCGCALALIGILAGCGTGAGPGPGPGGATAGGARSSAAAERSPTAFVPGQPTTQTLPGGARVTLRVEGPALAPLAPAGAPLAGATLLRETFAVTLNNEGPGSAAVDATQFSARSRRGELLPLTGAPQAMSLAPGASLRASITVEAEPGSGSLRWMPGNGVAVSYAFVAETH